MTSISDIKKNSEMKMDQSIASFTSSLSKIRTGRANPGLLDAIMVDYYGNPTPLSQVANVSLLDARTISVQPWEKGLGPKIEKAIRESDLGLNPSAMGDLIRVPMPPMTEERRKMGRMQKLQYAIYAEMRTKPLKNWSKTSWPLKMSKNVQKTIFRNSLINTLQT